MTSADQIPSDNPLLLSLADSNYPILSHPTVPSGSSFFSVGFHNNGSAIPRKNNIIQDIKDSNNTDEIKIVNFLTPYKISVAILVVLYLGNAIPKQQKPRIMDYIINFLDIHTKPSETAKEIFVEGDLSTLKDIINGTDTKSNHNPLHQHHPSSLSSSSFLMTSQNNEIFLQLLDVLFCMRSIDELHTFINRISTFFIYADGSKDEEDQRRLLEAKVMGIKPVKNTFILGMFFAKCFLSFDSLGFDDVVVLFDCLVAFREPYSAYYRTNKSLARTRSILPERSFESLSLETFFGQGFIRADDDDDIFLLKSLISSPQPSHCIARETLTTILDAKLMNIDRNDGLPLSEVNSFLDILSENNKELPVSAHYIKYSSALQSRDYKQAFEHLHRFYDYTMHHHGRAQYHNALFTLASLHAEFESFDESIRAVSEAISVARENKDGPALTNMHFWLYNFISLHPECKIPEFLPSKEQLLQFLKVKSQNTSYFLYSLALQQEAINQLAHCGSLALALESLYKSSFISMIANSVSSSTSYCTLESVTWDRLGVSSVSNLYNDISFSISKFSTAKLKSIEGSVQRANLLFDKGLLPEAFKILESVKSSVSSSQAFTRQWSWNYLLLKLRHRINECKFDEATFILERLASLNCMSYRTKTNYNIYKIILQAKSGMKAVAKNAAWSYLDTLVKEKCDIWYCLKLMIAYIELIMVSYGIIILVITIYIYFLLSNMIFLYLFYIKETERSSKAINVVLRLIFLADKGVVSIFKYYGIIFLARISADENEYSDAISLIDSIMPKV